jgi:hypothetical protein
LKHLADDRDRQQSIMRPHPWERRGIEGCGIEPSIGIEIVISNHHPTPPRMTTRTRRVKMNLEAKPNPRPTPRCKPPSRIILRPSRKRFIEERDLEHKARENRPRDWVRWEAGDKILGNNEVSTNAEMPVRLFDVTGSQGYI